jgi:hypothetical protein
LIISPTGLTHYSLFRYMSTAALTRANHIVSFLLRRNIMRVRRF